MSRTWPMVSSGCTVQQLRLWRVLRVRGRGGGQPGPAHRTTPDRGKGLSAQTKMADGEGIQSYEGRAAHTTGIEADSDRDTHTNICLQAGGHAHNLHKIINNHYLFNFNWFLVPIRFFMPLAVAISPLLFFYCTIKVIISGAQWRSLRLCLRYPRGKA